MREALFASRNPADGVLVAVSERGTAPPGTTSPTEFLARRFAERLGIGEVPIVRATQAHGRDVVEVAERPASGETRDAGPCDALVTRLAHVALVVQTADCVPVLLGATDVVGAVHAGWRGASANVAGAAADALLRLTSDAASVRAWLGPSIGACCYEVGHEVAELFAGVFVREIPNGSFRLDLPGVVWSQLESAGIPAGNIVVDPSCTMCGGERYASWRRDRERAGRMIALVARLENYAGVRSA